MRRYFLVMISCLLLQGLILPANAASSEESVAAFDRLKAEYPQVKFYKDGERITRIYGKPFGSGGSIDDVAEQFRIKYSQALGVEPNDLMPVSLLFDGRHTQPLMYNSVTGDYKFTLVYYSQFNGGIPVFRADLRLLVRNEPGFPLVMAASALKDLKEFGVDPAIAAIDPLQVQQSYAVRIPQMQNFSEPRMVIWAGIDDMQVTPTLGVEFIADNGMPATEKFLYIIDPQTGTPLYEENLIIFEDIIGRVDGLATTGIKADFCGPEEITPMPYARINVVGGNTVYADENADFIIPNGGSSPVTVESRVWGEWFRVYNDAGNDALLSQSVTPPGPANFLHNPNNTEFTRAEVNGYVHANLVRDLTLLHNPSYPVIRTQTSFPVYVNAVGGYCPGNAWYDGSSITFCRTGSGYPNTAFSTVVHHEYGHHLVAVGGSGQGAYGEGMGDVMGVLITDDPGTGWGFLGNCNQPLRDADNSMQYPCSGEIHYCGQLISGCVWDTRNELAITNPSTYRDIIASLAINAILLHSGSNIAPDITIDYLTLDDDDGNIYNGTPHYNEICAGFGAHNMDCPELDLISFEYPNGLPERLDPLTSTPIRVEVHAVTGTPQPGTGIVYYDDGSGWASQSMEVVSPNIYDAILPGFDCGREIRYYFSAEDMQGTIVNDPRDAPSTTFSVFSAVDLLTTFEDNFNTNQGWTVQNSGGLNDGAWERAIPAGGGDRGDPATDYDGSGYCYVTDNADGNSDVDDGYTNLISPTFDLSQGEQIFQYALWYTNYYGDDPYNDLFKVWISSNNGANWIHVETFGPVTQSGWTEHSFTVGDYIAPSSQVKIKFEASDLNSGSIVEAGIDAVSILSIECELLPVGTIYGTVTDVDTGDPISGVQVNADDGGGNSGSDVTAGDGSYSISLTPGTYTVLFTHANHYDATIPGVSVTDGGNTLLDVEMEPLPSQEIPTLSEWGMIILTLLLITAGTIAVIRRRNPAIEETK